MEKKALHVCLWIIAGMLIYAALSAASYDRVSFSRTEEKKAQIWNDRMEQTVEDGVYSFKTVLPREGIDGMVIIYNTVHMNLQVKIGGELVYSLGAKEGSAIKTTGYEWNRIPLIKEDGGKEICFLVTPVYADSYPGGQFYFGTRSDVERLILNERMPRFLVAFVILLVGILLKVYDWLIVRKEQEGKNVLLLHFSVFAIMLGIWSLCETQVLELVFEKSIMLVFLDHLMLMCMPVPFLLFLRQMYQNREHILWKICCVTNLVVVLIRVLMQVVGIQELRETLWMTHICLGFTILIISAMSVHEIVLNKVSRQLKLNILCVLVIMAATISELFVYRISNKSTPLGSLGFLFYIIVMGAMSLRKSRMIMNRARENEIYRRLAFIDELTGVYNRTAFNRDKESRMISAQETKQGKILPTVMFMFDLNDLKKCNDTYGHEYGDQYIIMVCDVLKRVFELDGKCYRIGGDEFCVMMPYVSENEIKNKLTRFHRGIREKNRAGFVVVLSVAAGYGIYDSSLDKNLDDTMRRADELMYREKQRMKAAL